MTFQDFPRKRNPIALNQEGLPCLPKDGRLRSLFSYETGALFSPFLSYFCILPPRFLLTVCTVYLHCLSSSQQAARESSRRFVTRTSDATLAQWLVQYPL